MGRRIMAILLTTVLMVVMVGCAFAISGSVDGKVVAKGAELPIVGSHEKLVELLKKAEESNSSYYGIRGGIRRFGGFMEKAATGVMKGAPAPAAAPADDAATSAGADYSATNVQVAGVDEGDLVKTDGQYIYQVNQGRVVIINADPKRMEIQGIETFPQDFHPFELYVDDKQMVVIGNSFKKMPDFKPGPIRPMPEREAFYPVFYDKPMIKVLVYDLKDKANLKLVKTVELEGNYVSSRKVDSALYVVTNRYLGYWIGIPEEDGNLPLYRDSALTQEEYQTIDYQDIRYFPEFQTPNYLLVAGINLAKPDEKAQIDAYLGAGEEIYASREHLFVAVTSYETKREALILPRVEDRQVKTWIYKFALEKGKLDYLGHGEVPGRILNQFSMDEYDGHFRIATTTGEIWRDDEGTSKNNLYILDRDLTIKGKVEGIAPGEQIYSVRFMGEKAYMVTFKTVDPLFVLDLKDPADPKILGALKIPGYSDYLHPYDENYIIGFGKDTVEISQKDVKGKVVGTMAFYQGMKVALFDVTEPTNPKELFVELIGDRGTESELLHNHRALLFSKEKDVLAFPVTVMEAKKDNSRSAEWSPPYGEFAFQGAYVYQLNPKDGFKLQGRITHLTDEDYLKSGGYWYGSNRNVERIIYIGDYLYTLSKECVKVHNLKDLKPLGSLEIPLFK